MTLSSASDTSTPSTDASLLNGPSQEEQSQQVFYISESEHVVLCCTVLNCVSLCFTVLHCVALCCTVLHCVNRPYMAPAGGDRCRVNDALIVPLPSHSC